MIGHSFALELILCDGDRFQPHLFPTIQVILNEKSYSFFSVNVFKIPIPPHFRSELEHNTEKLGTQKTCITAERKTNKKFQTI